MMDFEGAIAEIKNKDNAENFNKSVHSLQAIVDNLLANGTHGLAALKTLIDAIASDLDNGSYGLPALEALVIEIETKLDDGTTGLAALKALIDALGSELGSGTYGLAVLKVFIDAVAARLDNGTSGLVALKVLLDAVQAKLDKLAGEAPMSGSVTGNWQSGTATSGEAGAKHPPSLRIEKSAKTTIANLRVLSTKHPSYSSNSGFALPAGREDYLSTTHAVKRRGFCVRRIPGCWNSKKFEGARFELATFGL